MKKILLLPGLLAVLVDANAAQYATFDPATTPPACTLSNGNLTLNCSNGTNDSVTQSNLGVSSGSWYWEYTINSFSQPDIVVGVAPQSASYYAGYSPGGFGYGQNGSIYVSQTLASTTAASYTAHDVIGIAYDATTGTVTFYNNGISQGSYSSASAVGLDEYGRVAYSAINGDSYSITANFGASPFFNPPPGQYNPGLYTGQNQVPEPASVLLLSAGILSLALAGKRAALRKS